MTRPTLYFVHGWACDASIWDRLRAQLQDWPQAVAEAGYFGAPPQAVPAGPVIAIAHSLGGMTLLAAAPPDCRALVLINSFARLGAAPGLGVPARLLDRMRARLRTQPHALLADFHRQAGSDTGPPAGEPDIDRLDRDLLRLRDEDRLTELRAWHRPLCSLAARADAIVPEVLSRADLPGPTHWHDGGGHMLPRSAAGWCAAHIRAFLATLPPQ